MSDDTAKAILSTSVFLAIGLVVWDEIHNRHRLPLPSRFVSVGLVWGTLGFVAPFVSYPLAAAVAAGFLVALYYRHYNGKDTSLIPGLVTDAPSGTSSKPQAGLSPLQTKPLD